MKPQAVLVQTPGKSDEDSEMNTLLPSDWRRIRRWMYRNARPLDLARWRYHFENGGVSDVLQALSAYQNDDGGFMYRLRDGGRHRGR